MSLSKEWAFLARAMYGQEFIDEIANFLSKQNVKTILECGCGDGYVLRGLAQKGFKGVGIDLDTEMISLALSNNQHPNISYQEMNWLDIENLQRKFDLVMCRGNSLSYVEGWDKQAINSEEAKKKIRESMGLFFEVTNPNGLIYVDTISEEELKEQGGNVEIKTEDICLKGKIEHDWQARTRKTYGSGKLQNEDFKGGAVSYLLTPHELEELVKSYSPSVVWMPELKHERNYHVVCARK